VPCPQFQLYKIGYWAVLWVRSVVLCKWIWVVDESPGLWILIEWQCVCVCVCVFEVDSFGMDCEGSFSL